MTKISYDFAGKTVIVTGAARGIGRAISMAFLHAGAIVYSVDLNFDRDAEVREIQVVCDLSIPYEIQRMLGPIAEQEVDVAALVNNAGSDRRITFDQMSQKDWQFMLDVNLSHFVALSQIFLKNLKANGGGAIVNMSSSAWMKLAGNLTAYHTAKAGIVGLTRGMARDLGPDFVRANAIAPGRVVTERIAGKIDQDWIDETHSLQCLPLLTQTEDIAQTALWLCSDGAKMITGQTIVVDGGVV